MSLEASVSQVRHQLKELGDRVEHNDKDEWRVVNNIASERILSESEKAERDSLEIIVQQAFFIAGKALKDLRDKRLYRETHSTFKSYVRDRFDFTRRAIEETKVLLQQIERWVTQSNGKLIEVQESKHRTKWYPACLIDVALGEDRKTA